MKPPAQPPALPLRLGAFHRLGVVTDRPRQAVLDWFADVLGATPCTTDMPAVHGYPRLPVDDVPEGGESGATSDVLWVGAAPIAVFLPAGPASPVAGFLRRFGPGVHSLAWTVDDLWTAEALLRRAGVRITGTDIAGRHIFMHPKDSAGVLIEWTDTDFADDPRDSGPTTSAGRVPVRGIERVTALVHDVGESAATLMRIMQCEASPAHLDGPDRGSDADVLDLSVGGLTVRLVAPDGTDTAHARSLADAGERLISVTWALREPSNAAEQLAAAGLHVLAGSGSRWVTDPADTLGIPMEWEAA